MTPPMDPTRAPANGKGPGATKSKKASEPCPGTVASTGPATQPSDLLKKHYHMVQDVAKVATGAEIVRIIISVIFVE